MTLSHRDKTKSTLIGAVVGVLISSPLLVAACLVEPQKKPPAVVFPEGPPYRVLSYEEAAARAERRKRVQKAPTAKPAKPAEDIAQQLEAAARFVRERCR